MTGFILYLHLATLLATFTIKAERVRQPDSMEEHPDLSNDGEQAFVPPPVEHEVSFESEESDLLEGMCAILSYARNDMERNIRSMTAYGQTINVFSGLLGAPEFHIAIMFSTLTLFLSSLTSRERISKMELFIFIVSIVTGSLIEDFDRWSQLKVVRLVSNHEVARIILMGCIFIPFFSAMVRTITSVNSYRRLLADIAHILKP